MRRECGSLILLEKIYPRLFTREDIPEIIEELQQLADGKQSGGMTGKIRHGNANIDLKKVIKVVDEVGVSNYTFDLEVEGAPENYFYNLVVSKNRHGKKKEVYVIGYEIDADVLAYFMNGGEDQERFRATYHRYNFARFFSDYKGSIKGKIGDCGSGPVGGGGTTGPPTTPGGTLVNTAYGTTVTTHFGPHTSGVSYNYYSSVTYNGHV